jgi:hypothetical protein
VGEERRDPSNGERDPRFARYGWFVVMNADPSENLALLAGEIFNNLRSALDYIAHQIYLKGGGEPDAKQAKYVAFPIVTEEARWDTAVAANVPYAWHEAVEKLKWCQPFVQLGQEITALPALRVHPVGRQRRHVIAPAAIELREFIDGRGAFQAAVTGCPCGDAAAVPSSPIQI